MDQSNKKRRPALELDFPIRSSDFSVVTNRRSDGFRASNNLVKVCEPVSTELEARAELETASLMLILTDLTFRQWITLIQESITV